MIDNNTNISNTVNDSPDSESLRKPGIRSASMIFSINILLLIVLASRAQQRDMYSGIIITEYALMLMPPLLLLYIGRYNIPKVLRFHRIGFINAIMVVFIMLLAIPLVSTLNVVNIIILKQLVGKVELIQPSVSATLPGFAISLFVICITPAICEEVLYRGVIQRGFEDMGASRSIFASALLFGFMHMDFQKLLGTFLLGALISFIVYRTNSLFAGMLAHFTNNAFSLVMTIVSSRINKISGDIYAGNTQVEVPNFDIGQFSNMPKVEIISAVLGVLLFVLFFSVCLGALITAFISNTSGRQKSLAVRKRVKLAGMLWLIPGFIFIIMYYILQFSSLSGMKFNWINSFMKLILPG